MKPPLVLTRAFLALLAPALAPGADHPPPRPNIVFILSDDQGYADVGYRGSEIRTPHLDRLAAEGVKLEQFYVQPVCTPTRAAFLSGQYPMRLGLQLGVIKPGSKHGLPLHVRTLPQALADAGYFTAITGKWHLGNGGPEYLPTCRGFAHQHGLYLGMHDYFTHEREGGLDWHRQDRSLRQEGYATDLIGDEAVDLIERHGAARPFFLYVAFNAPHTPLQAPDSYLARYSHIADKKRRAYAAMVTAMDDNIGRIVAALERRGLRERTLIVFSSDNGGNLPAASNAPLRDQKGALYEGGVRVPAFAVWPGTLPRGTATQQPLHIVDWHATLLRLAGTPPAAGVKLDGHDLWPALLGEPRLVRQEVLINAAPGTGAFRRGDWKLVINGHLRYKAESPGPHFSWTEIAQKSGLTPEEASRQQIELFNLADDPGESRNLADRHPGKVRELRRRYEAYAREAAPLLDGTVADDTVPAVWGEYPATKS
jgi:arylsulfatase A-like enzyme